MKIYKRFTWCLAIVALCLCQATQSYAQQNPIQITGKVVDTDGLPMAGVTVLVKGQSTGTITGSNGEFELRTSSGATLVFSSLGYMQQEVMAGHDMNVVMEQSIDVLEDVVVIGYGTAKKKDLTGDLAVIGKKELDMVSTSNLMDRLVGQVAGFNITTSNAAPGASQTLRIRGENSLTANNDPLIVLDGIPYTGTLADIDPNIVDNMSVLKDASSVAIYGARASNGVILIQTKRGSIGKAQVTYKGSFSISEPMQRIQAMGPNEYIRLKQDIGRLYHGYSGADLDPLEGKVISVTERNNYLNGVTHDWQDYVFRTTFTHDHQLSVSGGTESTKYMAAVAYLDQQGVVYNSQLKRINISANIDQTLNKWLTIGVATTFVQRDISGLTPNLEHAIKQSPYGQYKDETGRYVFAPQEYMNMPNPMQNVNADNENINRNFFVSGYVNIQLFKGLSFRSNVGYNYRNGFNGTYYGRDTERGKEGDNVGGASSISNSNYNDWTWENVLTYQGVWGNHRFDATGLFSATERRTISSGLSGDGYVTDDTSFFVMGTAERNKDISSGESKRGMLSQMLRLNYAFKDKYMLTLTARRDGSTVFGANNKHAFFPSAAFAWQIGDEGFMQSASSWIDMLKLRVSYGAVGNEAIDPYMSLNRLYSSIKYIWGDAGKLANSAYLATDGIGNPNLKWETTYTANVAVDFSFFGGRLGGTLGLYLSRTHDLLMKRTIPILNGYNTIMDNIGKTENKGIELTLNTVNIQNQNFRWSTDIVFSLNRDKIVELRGDGRDDVNNKWFIGKPLRVIYDYNVLGIWKTGDNMTFIDKDGNEKTIANAAPGNARIEDLNNDGSFDIDNDRKVIGSTNPSFTLSMSNRFSYKNWYASFLLNGVFGVWRADNVRNINSWTFGTVNYIHGAKYWTPEDENADIPSPGYRNPLEHGYYKKWNHVTLKNVTVGYRLPSRISEKIGLRVIDINVSVNNVGVISNMRQILNYDNGWFASYPTARSYILGVNLTF